MARLGKYSGQIYEDNEIDIMQECGVCISDEQKEDDDWISQHHLKDLMDCVKCCGCPLAQRGIINT